MPPDAPINRHAIVNSPSRLTSSSSPWSVGTRDSTAGETSTDDEEDHDQRQRTENPQLLSGFRLEERLATERSIAGSTEQVDSVTFARNEQLEDLEAVHLRLEG